MVKMDEKAGSSRAKAAQKAQGATKKAATPRVKKEVVMNDCGCGCGGKTPRRFLPGHDAKLKGRLLKAAVDADATAAQRTEAEKQLRANNWGHFLDKARSTAERRANAKAERDTAAQERKDAQVAAKADRDAKKAEAKAAKAKAADEKKAAAKKAADEAKAAAKAAAATEQA